MRRLAAPIIISSGLLLAAASGCGGEGGTGAAGGGGASASKTGIVVGVTGDLRVGVDINRVHVTMRAGDAVVRDDDLSASSKPPLALPFELRFGALAPDEAVTVQLDAFRLGNTVTPLVRRLASSQAVADEDLLLRLQLDSRCAVSPGSSAPTCVAPATCIAGACASSLVDPRALPAYTPAWSKVSTDVCKPTGSGPPVVMVGSGQSDYLPTMDGDVAQVEAGPQGGHHIWVAIRMKGLLQSGSITAVTGHVPDLNLDIGPFQVIFTFDQDEGGYCKLYGLRFQLDQTTPIDQVLGHTVDLAVKVTDKEGGIGIGKRTVLLSKTFL